MEVSKHVMKYINFQRGSNRFQMVFMFRVGQSGTTANCLTKLQWKIPSHECTQQPIMLQGSQFHQIFRK